MKLSDYVFSFIAKQGVKEIFSVAGGGSMHLVDSLGRNNDIDYIAVHHEQAATMAAESYSRTTNNIGVALVTSGPGGTNTITGVCGAWIDSIPIIIISGQVNTKSMIRDTGVRQFGVQESDIIKIVDSITKYAVTIYDPLKIRYHLEKALFLAKNGRPGPVWIDIPINIQSAEIEPENLTSFEPNIPDETESNNDLNNKISQIVKLLKNSKRPVLISGYGIRLAGAKKEYKTLVENLQIPIIASSTTIDLIPNNNKYYIGCSGITGDRASNFTVQNSDLLIIIGSRMSIPQTGYSFEKFARKAKIIMVDIDKAELEKNTIKVNIKINIDAKIFINEFLKYLNKEEIKLDFSKWNNICHNWKIKYPVVLPNYENSNKINSYYFVDKLSNILKKNVIVFTDVGMSKSSTMQAFKTKSKQRILCSSGNASMGTGLPGAIGACFANNRKKTICISGDGGLQMNIQELQTIVQYKLPIKLFVFNNNGYLTIKTTQKNYFNRYVGSDPSSGLSCPDIKKIATAYGIKTDSISTNEEMNNKIEKILNEKGPFICEVNLDETQPIIPKVMSEKKSDGTIISKPLEDMYPFLDRDEFNKQMIIDTVDE